MRCKSYLNPEIKCNCLSNLSAKISMSYKSVLLDHLLSRKGSSLLSSGVRSQHNVSNVMQKQVNILLHCFSYNTDEFKIDLCLPLSTFHFPKHISFNCVHHSLFCLQGGRGNEKAKNLYKGKNA